MLPTLRISAHSLAVETVDMVQQKYQLIKDFVNSAPQMWKMRYIFFFQRPQYNLLRNEYNITSIVIFTILEIPVL